MRRVAALLPGLFVMFGACEAMAQPYFDNGASVMAAPTTSWVPSVDPTLGAGTFEDLETGAIEEPAPIEDTRVADVPVPMASTSVEADAQGPVTAALAPVSQQPDSGFTEEVSEAKSPAATGATIESPPPTGTSASRPTGGAAAPERQGGGMAALSAAPEMLAVAAEASNASSRWLAVGLAGTMIASVLVIAGAFIRALWTPRLR
jgi:hypothetical protein